ncbi:hypothetical protein N7537_009968 [Penicillium hordei]|uniref:Uncharacterized protein n=1 Tax=Penicillium hordei TaxID=40994 RepID=A0AAD6DV61_9EURO|nr:uncharacterized protein N7537_009968 [Penicillium hordei]KAJ5593064.1 hypothetical protein N7537_009968 [Penicillium hordei]
MASSSQSSPQQTSTTTGSPTAPAASSSTPTTSSNNTSTEPASRTVGQHKHDDSNSAHERFDQTVIYVGDWIGKLDHPDQFHCPSPKHTTDSTQI